MNIISKLQPAKRWLVMAGAAILLAGSVGAYTAGQRQNLRNLVAPGAEAASVDYFLKLDGIPGDSVDARHANEIEVDSFAWGKDKPGVVQPATTGGAGGGAGKATASDITFTMKSGKASPLLMTAAAGGKHLKDAVFVIRKAGTTQIEYIKISLTDVMVTSYKVDAGGGKGALAGDEITLSFGQVKLSYTPQKADGSAGTPIDGIFDFQANKGL